MPWDIQHENDQYCIHKRHDDGTLGERVDGGCHATHEEAEAHLKALYASVDETSEQSGETPITESQTNVQPAPDGVGEISPDQREAVHEISPVSTFRGQPPDIPVTGVNIEALTKGDDDPVFVTLKIAETGRVSGNGILYDDELVNAIVEQINRKHPGGIFGHIKEEDRKTAFPLPDALWVGATRVGDEAWGKAYIRNRAAAEYVRHLKAVAGQLGTSIWGAGYPEQIRAGVRRLRDFVLEQLDFAPPERASLQVAGPLVLTSEMQANQSTDEHKDTQTMDEKALREHLLSLKPDALAELLGDDTLESVVQMYSKKKGKKVVAAEMVTTSEAAETRIAELNSQNASQARELSTLRQRVAEYEKTEYEAGVKALVSEAVQWEAPNDDAKSALNSARSMITSALEQRMGDKRDLALAKAAIAELVDGQYQPVLAAMVRGLAGPGAVVGGKAGRDAFHEESDRLAKELGVV